VGEEDDDFDLNRSLADIINEKLGSTGE